MKAYPLTSDIADEIFEGTKDDKRVVGHTTDTNFRAALVNAHNFIPFIGELLEATIKAVDEGRAQPRDDKGRIKNLPPELVAQFAAPFLTAIHMGVLIGMNAASHAEEAQLAGTSK